MTRHASIGWWLALALVFIFLQATEGFSSDATTEFWSNQQCGYKEVETNRTAVPKKIEARIDALISADRKGCSAELIDGRVYTFGVYLIRNTSDYYLREIRVSMGGRLIFCSKEKICGKPARLVSNQ